MTESIKSQEEWANPEQKATAFGMAVQMSDGFLSDAIKRGVAGDILKATCDELGQQLVRSVRMHGMLPGRSATFLRDAEPFGVSTVAAKVYAMASGKPEDYVLYLTSMCKALLSENVIWREADREKAAFIDRLKDHFGSEKWAELCEKVPGYQAWWD